MKSTLKELASLYGGDGNKPEETNDDGDVDAEVLPAVTAAQALETVRLHLQQQRVVPEKVTSIITKLESILLITPRSKQSKISDFFRQL